MFDEEVKKSYNDGKEVPDFSDGKVHRIDRRNLKPLNDANCVHDYYEDSSDPDAANFRVFKCRNCIVGYLAPL